MLFSLVIIRAKSSTPSVAATSLEWMLEYITGTRISSSAPDLIWASTASGSVSACSVRASHLLTLGHIGEGHAIEQHPTALVPMGSERRLELAQKRRLPAAALPAYQHKLAWLDGHGNVAKGIAGRFRVAKRQLFESE